MVMPLSYYLITLPENLRDRRTIAVTNSSDHSGNHYPGARTNIVDIVRSWDYVDRNRN